MTLIETEHAIDALLSRLLNDLQSLNRGMIDPAIEDARKSGNISLPRLYVLGMKYGMRLAFCPNHDGKWYAYGGRWYEATKQMVFLYLNRKEVRPHKEWTVVRLSFEAIGGSEYNFTSWLVKHITPSVRPFFKLTVFLDVPVEWRRIPKDER